MFHRRRFKQIQALKQRLVMDVNRFREEAKTLPPGADREWKLRKARQAATAACIVERLSSPELRAPKRG